MKPIIWTEQSNFFGLDYSSKKGVFHDYEFDIRYDYEGDPKVKPENCGLYLTFVTCGSWEKESQNLE
jgi:hypothetical protein